MRLGRDKGHRAALVVFLLLLASCDGPQERGSSPAPTETSPAPIPQAKWKIKTHTAGARLLSNAERRRIRAEKPRLRRLVRDVYNGLFLSPGEGKSIIRARFTPRAAAALIRSDVGIAERLTAVRTTLRRARIGIGAASARQAAAQVWVRARAMNGGNKVRIVHRSTLWLQKEAGAWKAIAFDVKQRPAA